MFVPTRVLTVLALLLLILSPLPALADSGISISWGQTCWTDQQAYGTAWRLITWPGDTNTGSTTMTVSFMPGVACQVSAFELVIAGAAEPGIVPAWWQMGPGQCRDGALSTSADFRAASQEFCLDAWQGQATGGITSFTTSGRWPGGITMTVRYTLPAPVTLQADMEYYACQLTFDHRLTVGEGSCAGADVVVNLSPCTLQLMKPDGTPVLIDSEWQTEAFNQCVYWQGWIGGFCVGETYPCGGHGLPAHSSTWGKLKSLYR